MFDNPLFDTAIALITLYLLFSQLTLSLVELPAGALNTRGKYLYNRLQEALGPTLHGRFYAASTIQSICLPKQDKSRWLRGWISLWPAYISETLFAQTIIACVIGDKPDTAKTLLEQFKEGLDKLPAATKPLTPDATFAGALRTFYDNALGVGDTADAQSSALQHNIELWFHDFGERLTGRYKRDNRKYLFWMGLLVALLADIDTVRLARFIADSNNAKARLALVDAGAKALQGARPAEPGYNPTAAQVEQQKQQDADWSKLIATADTNLKNTLEAVPQVGLPIGWLRWTNYEVVPNDTATIFDPATKTRKYTTPLPCHWAPGADDYQMPTYAQRHILNPQTGNITDASSWHWTYMVGGWLLTAFAMMIGAPFWFDTLCRFINIRNVGIKPKPADKNQ